MEPPIESIMLPNEAWFAPMSRWKQRKERSKIVMLELLLDYAENTTLHGLRYTTEKGRMLFEKIFWLLTFLVSLGFALYLTYNVWYKWKTSPVIVSFNEKLVPVEMVPFPSLTICPQIKVNTSVYNFTEKLIYFFGDTFKNMSSDWNLKGLKIAHLDDVEEVKDFVDLSLICLPLLYTGILPKLNHIGHSPVEIIKKVAVTKKSFLLCKWLDEVKNCSEMFDTVLTEEGVCFNFNGMAAKEIFSNNVHEYSTYSDSTSTMKGWNWETGYIDGSSNETRYPYAGKFNKRLPALEVIFSVQSTDYDKYCNAANNGFKVYIQHPASHPQSSVYSYALLPDQVTSLAMKINVMNTSEKLRSYAPEVRQCYYNKERYLRYFNVYTYSNCMLECMSNFTYKACHCVPFHMPHHDSRYICSVKDEDCIGKTRVSEDLLSHINNECLCLPHCNYISYEPELLQSQFNFRNSMLGLYEITKQESTGPLKNTQFSKLQVYYKDPHYVSIVRSELFGVTEFFANIGGLLGLFLGFSFLSVVEIVYFVTIRIYPGWYYKNLHYVSIVRSEVFGVTEFFANISGLLGLFIGFSFLYNRQSRQRSVVEIVYFVTIRYGLALKKDFKEKKEAHERSASMKLFNVEHDTKTK